jgi:RNA 3'-terminal phosphate cyclase (ATP)
VAERAANEAAAWFAAGVPVGPHLADQLLLPLALAGGGRYRTMALTEHTRTEIETLRLFLPLEVRTTRVRELVSEVAVERA